MFDLIKNQWIGILAIAAIVFVIGMGGDEVASLGSNAPTTISNPHVFTNTLTMSGAVSHSGLTTMSGGVVYDASSISATTTLTSASDNVQLLPASSAMTTITLPAVADGLRFKFVVMGALTGSEVLIDSAEGDNISGSVFVNDALVACDAEDQVNIITDGEVIGDYVELISDGAGWHIIESRSEAAGKMTCTDPS